LFEKGEIVFVVEARAAGSAGKYLYSGLVWAEGVESSGLVIEHTCEMDGVIGEVESWRNVNTRTMEAKFEELVRSRDSSTKERDSLHVELSVPSGSFGCALVALVLF